ncbi:MAG: hypothetical protein AMJ88_13900 [Anaerolineae bacterium SM23_ 63]|nr:MAG: hypothetical protein AMJ88_13900 [Anaerolineae bacterium SM23_ 63]
MAIRTKILNSWFNACGLSLILAAFTFSPAMAQETTYDDVAAIFAWTPFAEWEAAGYEKLPFCYDGSTHGHPELGGLGFAAVNVPLVDDTIDPLEPEGLWLDAEDQVIGLAYMVPSRETDPPELFGHDFGPTPDEDYLGLNVWFVGALDDRFESYNPAVTCPEGTAYGS